MASQCRHWCGWSTLSQQRAISTVCQWWGDWRHEARATSQTSQGRITARITGTWLLWWSPQKKVTEISAAQLFQGSMLMEKVPAVKYTGETTHWTKFSPVQSFSRVWLFVTPWTAACQASLSITKSRSLLKLRSIESMMPSNSLILCRPRLLLPSIFPSTRVFSNESVLCIRWPKYSSFQILGGKILKPFEVLEFTTQLYVVSCFNIPHILIFLLTHGGIGKVNPSWYFIQRLCSFVSLSTWILWEVPCQIVNRKKERYC